MFKLNGQLIKSYTKISQDAIDPAKVLIDAILRLISLAIASIYSKDISDQYKDLKDNEQS